MSGKKKADLPELRAQRYLNTEPRVAKFIARIAREIYEGKISESKGKSVVYVLNSLLSAMREGQGPQAAVQINIMDAPGSGKTVEVKDTTPKQIEDPDKADDENPKS